MIKGDLRKKQILETAEALFTARGYENTGVQDILDQLHLSKGSFYHHFESKELVLRIICENRASQAAEKIRGEQQGTGLERMNRLLSAMIPLQGEGLAFLKMLLPVLTLPEGKSVLNGYRDALKRCWLPSTLEALEAMILERTAYTPYPEATAEILLDLVNDFWVGLCREMPGSAADGEESGLYAKLLSRAEPYRLAVENLISAPYGSLDLVRPEDMSRILEAFGPMLKTQVKGGIYG